MTINSFPIAQVDIADLSAADLKTLFGLVIGDIFDLTHFGLVNGGDIYTPITNALSESGSEAAIIIPPGNFICSQPVPINKDYINILGAGKLATTVSFEPSADAICFDFNEDLGEGTLDHCNLSDIGFKSTDTTYDKTLIRVRDAADFYMSNVLVTNILGGDSIGFHYSGRESLTVSHCRFRAPLPARISPNQETSPVGWLTLDQAHFLNTHFGGATDPATLTSCNVLIDDGVHVHNAMFSNCPMVGKDHGIYWVETVAPGGAGNNLTVLGGRKEGGANAASYSHVIDWSGAGTNFQGLKFIDHNLDIGTEGIYARGIETLTLDNVVHLNAGADLVDLDDVTSLEFINVSASSNATMTIPATLKLVRGKHPNGYNLPRTGSWQKESSFSNAEKPARVGMLHEWTYQAEMTNDLSISTPLNAPTQNVEHGFVEVSISDGSGIYGYAKFLIDPSAANNGVEKIEGTSNMVDTDTGSGGAANFCFYAGAAGLDDVRIRNRTNVTVKAIIRATYHRSVET